MAALRGAAAESTGVAAAQEHGNGLRAELLGVALPLLGDLGNRLIPANALELAATALAYTTHGVLQSLGAVHAGGWTRPFGQMRSNSGPSSK